MAVATKNDLRNVTIANNAVIKNNFVAKEAGKGLSSNDFTTAEKTKLASLSTNIDVDMTSEEISSMIADVWTEPEPEQQNGGE